jgi:hypothetical protein
MNIKIISTMSILAVVLLLGSIAWPTSVVRAETLEGKVTAVEKEGRVVKFGDKSANISGSRTEVQINGKPGDRADIKAGMTCTADLKGQSGSEAKLISCK